MLLSFSRVESGEGDDGQFDPRILTHFNQCFSNRIPEIFLSGVIGIDFPLSYTYVTFVRNERASTRETHCPSWKLIRKRTVCEGQKAEEGVGYGNKDNCFQYGVRLWLHCLNTTPFIYMHCKKLLLRVFKIFRKKLLCKTWCKLFLPVMPFFFWVWSYIFFVCGVGLSVVILVSEVYQIGLLRNTQQAVPAE